MKQKVLTKKKDKYDKARNQGIINEIDRPLWKGIDKVAPKHRIELRGTSDDCTDKEPNGWGNFGCKRCNLIRELNVEKK